MSERVLLIPLIIIPFGDLLAAFFFGYLFWISRQEPDQPGTQRSFTSRLLRGRSWLLALLSVKSVVVTVNFAFIGWLAYLRISDRPVEGASPFVIGSLIILGLLPMMFMFCFWVSRRRNGHPPPFNERD